MQVVHLPRARTMCPLPCTVAKERPFASAFPPDFLIVVFSLYGKDLLLCVSCSQKAKDLPRSANVSDETRSSQHDLQTEHQQDAVPNWDRRDWVSLAQLPCSDTLNRASARLWSSTDQGNKALVNATAALHQRFHHCLALVVKPWPIVTWPMKLIWSTTS